MLAKRNQQKPLIPPTYNMRNVPKCHNSGDVKLIGSQVQEITKREHFADNTGELVLLCNEVMRRQQIGSKQKTTSKPLSLEYIADRMDIDDPIFGYFVRTTVNSKAEDGAPVEAGMLQGFLMATTFTNWQTTFRWDSMHDSAFAYDDEILAKQTKLGARKYDKDGSLAAKLQATVRCGDPWNEGIVWPRIAEISLLGGLSCGKVLLELTIEKLERMPLTATRNYDYVALQATKNSLSFYERMGFIRVGAVTEDKLYLKRREARANGLDPTIEPSEDTVVQDTDKDGLASSPVEIYITKEGGETPHTVAKKFDLDVWDIIFLNHYLHKDILPKSWLYKGTQLFISSSTSKIEATTNVKYVPNDQLEVGQIPKWYNAKENETPRSISKKFKIACDQLIKANSRIEGLSPSIRLRQGTKLQISHFDITDDMFIPYNHWTFPDDVFENLDPSYMMVRKLNRKVAAEAKVKPTELSLHRRSKYIHSKHESSFFFTNNEETVSVKIRSKKNHLQPNEPIDAFSFFSKDARTRMNEQLARKTIVETNTIITSAWNDLPVSNRNQYEKMASKAKCDYEQAMKVVSSKTQKCSKKKELKRSKAPLFNQVVILNSEGIKYHGTDFPYYYALTYLPDLEWCHLCPMTQNGVLENGRPRWNLIDESQGKEIDTSALFCAVTESQGLHGCPDADEEEWDIFESKAIVGVEQTPNLSQNITSESELVNGIKPSTPTFPEKGLKNGIKSKKRKVTKASIELKAVLPNLSSNIPKHEGDSNELKVTQLMPKLPVNIPKNGVEPKKRKLKKSPKSRTEPKKGKATKSKPSVDRNTPKIESESNHQQMTQKVPSLAENISINEMESVRHTPKLHVHIPLNETKPARQIPKLFARNETDQVKDMPNLYANTSSNELDPKRQSSNLHASISINKIETGVLKPPVNSCRQETLTQGNTIYEHFPASPQFFSGTRPVHGHSESYLPENSIANGNGTHPRMPLPYHNMAHPVYHQSGPYLQNIQRSNGSGIRQGIPQEGVYHYHRMPQPVRHEEAYFRDMRNTDGSPRIPDEDVYHYNRMHDRYK